MSDLRPGELSDEELQEVWSSSGFGQGHRNVATAAYAKAMKRAAEICTEYARNKWSEYNTGHGEGRANPQWQGESDGASDCAEAIEREAGK